MMIELCPKCKSIGYPVEIYPVQSLSIKKFEKPINLNLAACLNNKCEVVYFYKSEYILQAELKNKIWYKSDSDDAIICYCSLITRNDIKLAVRHGCTSVADVRQYLKKNRTGYCKYENPLGKCCENVFANEIKEQLKLL